MLEVFKNDHELFHSSFQIENFILIKNGKTTFGIYKQCLRELISREGSLRTAYAQKLRADIDYAELMEKLGKLKAEDPDGFAIKRLQIDRAEMEYGLKDAEKVIRETEREYTHFYNAAIMLKEKLGDLTKERRLVLEQELWTEQCKYKACLEYNTLGGVSTETLGLVHSLPNQDKIKLLTFFGTIKNDPIQRDKFLMDYSKNFEFGERLDNKLDFEIKKLVEDNGS